MLKSKFRSIAASALVVGCLTAATSVAFAANQFVVQFRLVNWKTAHFHDAQKAQTLYNTLKHLGCEVKQHGHDDHLDVAYRCPKWRALSVKTDAGAHQWERWLRASGFETSHQH